MQEDDVYWSVHVPMPKLPQRGWFSYELYLLSRSDIKVLQRLSAPAHIIIEMKLILSFEDFTIILNLIARKYKMTISSTKTKSMAMWGNHMQRVKIAINDNIIEQVTDFKYLGYRILE